MRALAIGALLLSVQVLVEPAPGSFRRVAVWTASPHGPYPAGTAVAQPDLRFALPDPARGAVDQTFRMIVRPDLWGRTVRLRFANTVGTRPLVIDGVYVALQSRAGAVVPGTSRQVRFDRAESITIPPGTSMFSDSVGLPWIANVDDPLLAGRQLAVSFHVVGESGPITWHSKGLTTSYVTAPGAGSRGADEDDAAFPYTTTSWFFLDLVETIAPKETLVVAAFGDSITDGTGSTLNAGDRWPDVLSARLHARLGNRVAVLNAGIGGNRVARTDTLTAAAEARAGKPATERFRRDVLGLPGVTHVIWMEGINDLAAGAGAETVIGGMREVAALAHVPHVRIIAGTLTPALGAETAHGSVDVETRRQAINAFIRRTDLFDGVVDFDAATRDPQTFRLRPEFVPESTTGGPGDLLHPNRAGYRAMGEAVPLSLFVEPKR